MVRPAKNINLHSRHNTKEEIAKRSEVEERLKCGTDKIRPPNRLTKEQKKIFKYIVKELEPSEILSNLDVFLLEECSVAIDIVRQVNIKINADINTLRDKALMNGKKVHMQEFFRCCNELSLSPQSRARLGSLMLKSKENEEDPVKRALRGEDI